MIKLYNRLIRNCKSENMHNRIHIELENHMTPEQFFKLKRDFSIKSSFPVYLENVLSEIFPKLYRYFRFLKRKSLYFFHTENNANFKQNKYAKAWMQRIDSYMVKIQKNHPESFVKKRVNHHTWYFTSKDQTIKSKDKILLVCFTGARSRMMMPLPVFLQSLDANNTDIIYIRYSHPNGYLYGFRGYDQNFEAMLDRLGSLPFDNYGRVVGLGTSAGSIPSLLLALKYEFDAVMLCGSMGPHDVEWSKALGKEVECFIKDLTRNLKNIPSVYLVYGADSKIDTKNVAQLQPLLPGAKLLKINKAGHSAFEPLINSGQFVGLLAKTIFSNKKVNALKLR